MGLVHSLDYLQYVVASRIDRVYCEYATRATEADVEDTLSLSCRFANGAIGNWCASTCHAGDAVTSERIWGSRGSMSLKPTPGHFFLMRRHANWAPGRAHNMNIRDEVNFRAAWVDDMAAAVLQDREPIIGWQDARHMTALVDAAYRSQIAGQAVELPNLDSATAFARPMGAPVRMVA
jgi:predicted dehydrogenase